MNARGAIDIVRLFMEQREIGSTPVMFGQTHNQGQWTMTKASKQHVEVHDALDFVLRNCFQLNDVIGVRLGRGVATLPTVKHASRSLLIYWNSKRPNDYQLIDMDGTSVNLRHLIGP